jgi:hypothetical protein
MSISKYWREVWRTAFPTWRSVSSLIGLGVIFVNLLVYAGILPLPATMQLYVAVISSIAFVVVLLATTPRKMWIAAQQRIKALETEVVDRRAELETANAAITQLQTHRQALSQELQSKTTELSQLRLHHDLKSKWENLEVRFRSLIGRDFPINLTHVTDGRKYWQIVGNPSGITRDFTVIASIGGALLRQSEWFTSAHADLLAEQDTTQLWVDALFDLNFEDIRPGSSVHEMDGKDNVVCTQRSSNLGNIAAASVRLCVQAIAEETKVL